MPQQAGDGRHRHTTLLPFSGADVAEVVDGEAAHTEFHTLHTI